MEGPPLRGRGAGAHQALLREVNHLVLARATGGKPKAGTGNCSLRSNGLDLSPR